MNKVTVTRMETPEHHGDWHDAPVKWQVKGPGKELQKFSTKKDATLYARIRRKCLTMNEACLAYMRQA